ncbi:MAG TPA: EamA family transporter [Candidatus Anaerobutyricum stercoris]|uniref:EamA family transporter n=1 Tax=Candidatus Anaerobutyricum stercoris TaxID=2838457 RepID=A0A9D2EKV3_9FIRM|nr:EamA family transporter [Eubacterium sp. An3]OUO26710.1 multidrug DMT transporter permease [Eubacterium sp. An3]CVI73770.1 4-amino-4-deoxy-L-arabinose-phosphoundecaprenol flippase subunit ArnE [Eubacteriaceae bacterium CHKCI004]HIZ39584.1 EamA family transporter [Candidatus Anaerobutyricum stercoris]
MWLLFAFGSAFFAGVTAILAKCGIKNIDSNVATAVRTVVVLLFSWLMVFVVGSQSGITEIAPRTLVFLVLSGLATGASWLCYFHALQIGDINKVTPVDKSSVVLTMLLAFIFLGEEISALKVVCMVLIGAGTLLMIEKKKADVQTDKTGGLVWLLYAFGSAFFASLTSILGKVGIEGVESNLGTAIRTIVVLIMAWLVVAVTGKMSDVKKIDRTSWIFLILSGFATGGSWLCYYRALQTGPASVVVPVDKLSIVVTIVFSYIVFREKLSRKGLLGLIMIVAGTLLLVI